MHLIYDHYLPGWVRLCRNNIDEHQEALQHITKCMVDDRYDNVAQLNYEGAFLEPNTVHKFHIDTKVE
jgi:hypothetical protein